MRTWWVSFATDTAFLGLVLVDAKDFGSALLQINQAGQNPGGQVSAYALPPVEAIPAELVEEALPTYQLPRLQLMTRAEIDARLVGIVSQRELRERGEEIPEATEVVCEHCNNGTPHAH